MGEDANNKFYVKKTFHI